MGRRGYARLTARVFSGFWVLVVVLVSAGNSLASHCWNVVGREGDVTAAESVDNGQFLELGNNLHWIVGYVNGVWTTLRPEDVRSIVFSRWDSRTANMEKGCIGTVTTQEGETGTIEVPETTPYHVRTSLMTRSLSCSELKLVSRCGSLPGGVVNKAIENLVLLANPEGTATERKRQEDAIRLLLDPQTGSRHTDTLLGGGTPEGR